MVAVRACALAGAVVAGSLALGAGAGSSGAAPIVLTDGTFDAQVLSPEAGSWLVEAAAGASPRMSELEQLSLALQGSGVQVGVVDLDSDAQCGSSLAPGLKLYGPDKRAAPVLISRASAKLDPAQAAEKALGLIADAVSARLPKKQKQKEKPKPKPKAKRKAQAGSGRPLDLTDASFDDAVQSNDDAFLVALVAPWCGHCKALMPEWERAAKELEGSGVVVAQVDATANEGVARRFGVQGFPTIKFLPPGAANKADGDAVDYPGERSAEAIVTWALAEFERRGGQVTIDVPQVSSQDDFDELCEANGKCVLVFLPHLLDSGKAGREAEVEELRQAQRSARHIKFGWVEAGAQPAWEAAYSLEFGFPAVLLLRTHDGQQLGLTMKGSGFSATGLASFASSAKKLGEFAAAGWPDVADSQTWDGEEAQKPEDDDDFDLDAFLAEDD